MTVAVLAVLVWGGATGWAAAGPPEWADDRFRLWAQEKPGATGGTPEGAAMPSGGPDVSATELAKATQNPIADLISVPFQSNINFTLGRDDEVQYVLNVQPVIPLPLGKDWLMILRPIAPLVYQPDLRPGESGEFGLGDINLEVFFSPKLAGHWAVGGGPIFSFPTASSDLLKTGKWGIGPAAVVAYSNGPWVVGGLVANIWSFAGDDTRPDYSNFQLQPFINYNLGQGWYLVTAPLITAAWKAAPDDRWTVPLGGGAGRVFAIGRQRINAGAQLYYNVVRPDATRGPEWSVRLVVQFLFPR